ncbi:hypothetical protein M422DRAFT_53440 [Sphaerobolus stellatus SS14]|uniref:Helitron helicase-like domain-containing protein n=1 Tax=Sphaerobolus stellatus (strain SS14) TaxID=990650 RepID=A0A0C9UQ97_SPHS4|nr:hypothetical protein M422DRAFT_53440 [Sphaerobolus stellatus SS14]
MTFISLDDLPAKETLISTNPHPKAILTEGMLIHHPVLQLKHGELGGYVCVTCWRSLVEKNSCPKLALVNGLWIGEIPFKLSILILTEKILISLYYPSAHIIKLRPKRRNAKQWSSTTWQGLTGNVAMYHLRTEDVQMVVNPSTLPRSVEVLAAIVAITIVGPTSIPDKSLEDILQVQQEQVYDALLWLKTNNHLYANVYLDWDQLHQLPEHGIPNVILDNIQTNPEDNAAKETQPMVPDSEDESEDEGDYNIPLGFSNDDVVSDFSHNESSTDIALTQNAILDVDCTELDESFLMVSAMTNTSDRYQELTSQTDAVIHHDGHFISEFPRRDSNGVLIDSGPDDTNHLLGAFPYLFPYGKGGFEMDQNTPVSYTEHIRWALQYANRRFALHMPFLAQVFSVMQKHQIGSHEFKSYEAAIKALKPKDLLKVAEEERRGGVITNPTILSLRKILTTACCNVMGTDEARLTLRSKVKGFTLWRNQPNLWLTLNFTGDNDPIVQIFAGEEIDMDKFNVLFGPDKKTRLLNAAHDPYASAKIKHEDGIFGKIAAYLGVVKAQGRGSLHLHLLLWLQGAPPPNQLKDLFGSPLFRDHVATFIKNNIITHVDSLTEESIDKKIESPAMWRLHKECASVYSQPLDPQDPQFNEKSKLLEYSLAQVCHVHTCRDGCLVRKNRGFFCKRRCPWPLSKSVIVKENGEWRPKCIFNQLNCWNRILMFATRGNHDIQLLTNRPETQDITWYITKYSTKCQARSYNISTVLAQKLKYMKKPQAMTSHEANKKLISGFANSLTRLMEWSGQNIIVSLMGWGDYIISHVFVPIYSTSAMWALRKHFPEFQNNLHWK